MTIEEHLYMGKIACITGSIALAGPAVSLAPLPGLPRPLFRQSRVRKLGSGKWERSSLFPAPRRLPALSGALVSLPVDGYLSSRKKDRSF